MLRIISLNILPGMLLSACVIGICTATVEAQNLPANKQMYSNRAIGYTVPTPYYGTPATPLFMVPPEAPVHIQTAHTEVRADASAAPAEPVFLAPDVRELSVPKTFEIIHHSPVVNPVPKFSVDDELDALYARLAKIQLEKHQLDEALILVKNIKSEIFRARTLVNLAEYVSRDKNYQGEAEQLYRLALSSMEALDKPVDSSPAAPQPPVVPVPDESAVPTPADQPPPGQGRPSPILFQDDSAKRNGKLPPPNPPRSSGIDGGLELERIVGSL